MKIVMLGNQRVGKTTYMASLYGILQQQVQEFSLRTDNTTDGYELVKLANDISVGDYPGNTKIRSKYSFYLKYRGVDILPFEWSDYRGSAIRGTEDDQQLMLLLKDLKEAAAIMIFCSCETLVSQNKWEARNEIRRMTVLMSQALSEIDRPISISIILTKADKLESFTEEIFQPFQGLIDLVNSNKEIMAAFIPITCGYRFINVPLPLLLSLYCSVLYQALLAKCYLQETISEYRVIQEKNQGFGGLFRAAFNNDSYQQNERDMESKLQEAQKMNQIYEFISEGVQALGGYLNDLPFIQNDLKFRDYALNCLDLKRNYQLSRSSKVFPKDWF